jgi:hypothetical protein
MRCRMNRYREVFTEYCADERFDEELGDIGAWVFPRSSLTSNRSSR